MATVYERVRAVVVERLRVDTSQVVKEARLEEDLKADSLDIGDLVLALEEEFEGDVAEQFKDSQGEFHIPNERVLELPTIGHIVDYLKEIGVEETVDV